MRPTLAQIGVKAVEARRPQSTAGDRTIGEPVADDHFVERNGLRFAGTHLILDLWEAERLDDADYMRSVLERAIAASGATLLHIHLHRFGDGGGVSGVAVLAESHISVHTWPERAFAAFDVFMCGRADPYAVIPVLKDAFQPGRVTIAEHMRGILG